MKRSKTRPLIRVLEWIDAARHRARAGRLPAYRAAGMRGEDLAQRLLQRMGYRVVARNYRGMSGGEIDIVAWDGPQLVFVEVKSRATDEYGEPDRAIDGLKRALIRRGADAYCRRLDLALEDIRFDVVNVVFGPPVRLELLRDAFSLREPFA